MKKQVVIFILAIVVTGSIFAGRFYYKNLRGAWPALQKPVQDVSVLLDLSKKVPHDDVATSPFKLPPGFSVSVFAKDLGAPRVMVWDGLGNLLVSIPKDGVVMALRDSNGDGIVDVRQTLVERARNPHGLAVRCDPPYVGKIQECQLYVASEDAITLYRYSAQNMPAQKIETLVKLPAGGRHTTRTIMIDPNDPTKLLVSIGSSCDVCHEKDPERGVIYELNLATKELKPYAKGLRNSVFMATHPVNGKVWATEMGRDYLGDNLPPDEINIIDPPTEFGVKNYGWPICYGKNIHDTNFDKNTYIKNPCEEPQQTPSYIDIPAHSAPLGLAFVPEEGWPQEYWHNLFVAYHGSWNRNIPTGYKIVRYQLDAKGNMLGATDFMTGFIDQKNRVIGRPVDILIQPGGVMYVSDDKAGVIYKIQLSNSALLKTVL